MKGVLTGSGNREPVLFGLNPKIEMVPVITAEDLQNDFSGVRGSIQLYG
jgi:hypothetical protein